MAAEVENPPVTTEEKQEETAAPAVEAPAADETPATTGEEVKEALVVKEPPPKKLNVFKQNFEKDVVYLYQFARTTSLPSLSPYVLKVETWLRLTGMKYEVSLLNPNIPSRILILWNFIIFFNPEYRSQSSPNLIGINWI